MYEKVSFYIPARNAEKTLAKAIESVLVQTYPIYEILIIVDVRSQDKTLEVAQKYKVKIIKQKEGGTGLARNLALFNAQGNFLASADSDNVLDKNFLKILMKNFADKNIAMVGGNLQEVVNNVYDKWREINIPHNWGAYSFYNPYMLVSTGCANKEILLRLGGYNNQFLFCYEDSDLCFRIKDAGYQIYYEKNALAYHLRQDNLITLLDNFWRFKTFKKTIPNTLTDLQQKINTNLMLALTTTNKVLPKNNPYLTYISFFLPFHHILKDSEFYFNQRFLINAGLRNYYLKILLNLYEEILSQEDKKLKQDILTDIKKFLKIKELKEIPQNNSLPSFNIYLKTVKQKLQNYLKETPSIIKEHLITKKALQFKNPKISKKYFLTTNHNFYLDYVLAYLTKNKTIFFYKKIPLILKEKLKEKKIRFKVVKNLTKKQSIVFHLYLASETSPYKILNKLKNITQKELILLVIYPKKIILNYNLLYPRDLAQWQAVNNFSIKKFFIHLGGFFLHLIKNTLN